MREALAFLTPFGRASSPTPRTMRWFPVVGILIGGVLGLVWWLADEWWLPLVAGAIVVVVDLGLTNLLHLDGLADSADGLLPPLGSPSRRLDVMADPTTGAFGVGTVAAVLILRFAAFTQAAPVLNSDFPLTGTWDGVSQGWLAMSLTLGRDLGHVADGHGGRRPDPSVHARGRTGDRVPPGSVRGRRRRGTGPGRLGAAVDAGRRRGGSGHARGGRRRLAWPSGHRVVPLGPAVFALARRRIGGFTGDVLGAAGMVGESVALLALSLFRIN